MVMVEVCVSFVESSENNVVVESSGVDCLKKRLAQLTFSSISITFSSSEMLSRSTKLSNSTLEFSSLRADLDSIVFISFFVRV